MKRVITILLLLLVSLHADYFTDARTAYHNKDYKNSISILDKACQNGTSDACFVLGIMYDTGEVVKQDSDLAVTLYTKACDASMSKSCGRLGTIYFHGISVTKDQQRGKALYTKACDNGHAESCIRLGGIYENSDGVEDRPVVTQRKLLPAFFNYDEDMRKAKELYSKACELGNSEGCTLFKKLNYLNL